MAATCSATRRDGSPCQGPVLDDAGLCWAHSPAVAAKRAEKRRLGGANRATNKRLDRLMPASLKPAIALLYQALEEVHRGDLDARNAGAMAALAGAIARLYQTGVLEDRVSALEQANGVRRA